MNLTTISKILVIAVAVASVAFMGFAMATSYGSPSWLQMADADYFNGYKIGRTTDADPKWVATRGRDETQVATSKVLPAVLAKVMDEVEQQRQQEIRDLRDRKPKLEERIALLEATRPIDEAALQEYEKAQRAILAQTVKQLEETGMKLAAATAEAQKLENQVAARRDDVFRLERQVEELRADQFRLGQLRQRLEDLHTQIEGDLERAREREAQLNRQLQQSPSGTRSTVKAGE